MSSEIESFNGKTGESMRKRLGSGVSTVWRFSCNKTVGFLEKLRPEYWVESSWFWDEMDERKKRGGNVVALTTGPPNIGKSYWDMELCREMHERWGLPKFDESGIVFNPSQFWQRMRQMADADVQYGWTLWDEPNKGLSHRDWYKAMNQAVVTFMQTFRFKHQNLVLALPIARLVDKSARAVCLFEAMMKKPGLAGIKQIEMDYYGNKEWYKIPRGELDLPMPPRSLYEAYERKKDEFHKSDFPEEAFQETPIVPVELKGWKRIYELVKASPENYRVQDPRNPQNPGRLSARKISALLDCSDNTARKVVTKIEFENAS